MTANREPVDPVLDAMLHDAAETPPAHVDAAIMAAAHRAVGALPRARSRRHWLRFLPLAAAAAVTAVVIGLQGVEQPAYDATRASDVPRDATRRQSAAMADRSNKSEAAGAPSSAPAPQPSSAAPSAHRPDEARSTNTPIAEDARVAAAIERIRALRRDGREAEAVSALAALRATVSDADRRLPADLRTWASTVRR